MQLKVVNQALADGIVGELYSNQPIRTKGFFLNSLDNAGKDISPFNIIGNIVFYNQKNEKQVGHYLTYSNSSWSVTADQQGDVAGILGFPKTYFRNGLSPASYLDNVQQAEVIQQGYVFVNLVGVATGGSVQFGSQIGDYIYYDPITGKLTSFPKNKDPIAKWVRLQGATVAIRQVKAPAENETQIGIIYIDLAGDKSDAKA